MVMTRTFFAAIAVALVSFATTSVQAQVREAPMFRSPSDLPETIETNDNVGAEYYYYNDAYYWDSPCRPTMISMGGKVLAATTTMPNIYGVGGAFTMGLEWDPLYICSDYGQPVVLSPILNWDIGGMGTMPQMQLDDNPDYRQASGYFFSAIQPGLRLRKPLHDDANCYLQAGFDVRYSSTDFATVAFEPTFDQVPVDMWTDEDWTAGYFVGGGFEHVLGPHIIRTGVNFESYGTRLMTGYKRQESQIAVVIELIYGR